MIVKANVHPFGVTRAALPTIQREYTEDSVLSLGEVCGRAIEKAKREGFEIADHKDFVILVSFGTK